MKRLGLLAAVLSVCLISTSFAHNGEITIDPIAYDNLNPYDTIDVGHNDMDTGYGFKGTFTVNVTNTGTEQWGDFHFEITDGIGGDAASVLFTDAVNPTSSQSDLSWTIDNPVGGLSSIDLFFYGDPVNPGETASFAVYTDNTDEKLSWFGMCIYPTPVPEPATMALLGIGGLALIRRKK